MTWSRLVSVLLVAFAALTSGCGGDESGPASPGPDGNDAARDSAVVDRPDVATHHDASAEVIGSDTSADGYVPPQADVSMEADAALQADTSVEPDAAPHSDAPMDADAALGVDAAPDVGTAVDGRVESGVDAADDAVTEGDATVPYPDLLAITVTPSAPLLFPKMSLSLTATGTFYDPSTDSTTTRDITRLVTWSSMTPAALVSNTPGFRGRVTAIEEGTATILATSGSVSGMATVTIGSPALVEIGIAGSPYFPSLVPRQLFATALWSTSDRQDITSGVAWSSSYPMIASFEGRPGVVVGKATGSAILTATFANLSDSMVISVRASGAIAIAVTPSAATIAKQTRQQLVATVTFNDGSTEDLSPFVTWTSSNPGAVDITGPARKMFAVATGVGTSTITAYLQGQSGTAELIVSPATLDSLQVTPDRPSYPMWTAHPLRATGKFSDGSTQDMTDSVVWASSDDAVSEGRKIGSSTVTATYLGVSGSTVVTVVEAILDSIAITPAAPTVAYGDTQAFRAEATYLDANAAPFKFDLTSEAGWWSSDKTVAKISNAPGSYGVATSLREGATTIRGGFTGVSGATVLTVAAPLHR